MVLMKEDTKKNLWRLFYWLNWLVIFGFWYSHSGQQLSDWTGALVSLGRIAGLAAAFMILVQFFLVGRNPLLEKVFGLDRLTKIHHSHGQWALILLLLHPLLITYGYSRTTGVNYGTQFWTFLTEYDHIWLAAIGLLLFITVAVTSIIFARRHYRYEAWYVVHLLVYAAIFVSFWHQINLGQDLLVNNIFYLYWLVLYA
ncbi:MAG: ferric reductase-like transmembrane domain-containing protein, partial [Candidatus Komeilibacteria bacterium]|nr:ferric reductase-like transmembrane domain-containing protein [Candidatus Komeilibacteria bacterium]